MSQETSIDNRTSFKIVLKKDSKTLESGSYWLWNSKEEDLTGAAAVKGDDLVAKNDNSFYCIQGSVSGMMVRRDNNVWCFC